MDSEDNIALMALTSPNRTMSYANVAGHLGIPMEEVERTLIRAIADGRLLGTVDSETSTLIIDGTNKSLVSDDMLQQALADLHRFDTMLSVNVDEPKGHNKRTHSDLQ